MRLFIGDYWRYPTIRVQIPVPPNLFLYDYLVQGLFLFVVSHIPEFVEYEEACRDYEEAYDDERHYPAGCEFRKSHEMDFSVLSVKVF